MLYGSSGGNPCAPEGALVFAYTPPSDGLLLVDLEGMALNRGGIFLRTECAFDVSEPAATLACDA